MDKKILIYFGFGLILLLFINFVLALQSSCSDEDSNFFNSRDCTLYEDETLQINLGEKNYDVNIISVYTNEVKINVNKKDDSWTGINPWEWTIEKGETNEFTDLIIKANEINSDNAKLSLITSNCVDTQCIFFHAGVANATINEEEHRLWMGLYSENSPTIGVDDESEVLLEGETKTIGNLNVTLNEIGIYGYDYVLGEQGEPIKYIIISLSKTETTTSEEECTDSDGDNINVKGTVSINGINYADKCVDSNTVTEYTCANNEKQETNYDCSSGYECQNGACVVKEERGETSTCTDSDDGKDYYVKGIVEGYNFAYNDEIDAKDHCVNNILFEYYCLENYTVGMRWNYGQEEYNCPQRYICQNGACIEREEPSCFNQGENSEQCQTYKGEEIGVKARINKRYYGVVIQDINSEGVNLIVNDKETGYLKIGDKKVIKKTIIEIKEIDEDLEQITFSIEKAGFFQRIGGWFRNLFG